MLLWETQISRVDYLSAPVEKLGLVAKGNEVISCSTVTASNAEVQTNTAC